MRALVLSGGGSKGAYEAGALKFMMGDQGIEYDALCGVSVGAINVLHLAQYGSGEGQEAVDALEELWSNLTTKDVYKRWCPFGRLHALWVFNWCKCMRRPSLYDSRPLKKFLEEHSDLEKIKAVGKILRFGAASLNTEKYRAFTENDDIIKAVLASSAFPLALIPQEIDGDLWTDGGVVDITPLSEAFALGATEIDVIITSPEDAKPSSIGKNPAGLDVGLRCIDIQSTTILADDVKIALLYNELARLGEAPKGKRHADLRILRPKESLGVSSLEFNPEDSVRLMKQGYEDAKDVFG